MLIGKPGAARRPRSPPASSDRIMVRGRDLAHDLMGRATFTEYVFLLATGRAPTEEQRFFLDLSLVALAEHGLTPSVQAARMTYDADPAALQGAIAAGVLGCGSVILGTADLCRKVIEDVLGSRRRAAAALDAAALDVAREYRERRQPLPGYGHPLHKPVDPRAERMIALARERGVAGRSVEAALALTKAAAEAWGKPLPMNVSMTIAATLRDVDVPPGLIRAVADPRPHRRPHRPLHRGGREPDRLPDGLEGRGGDPSHRGRGRSRLMMVEPEIEQAPWEEQARSDAPLYLRQIEYLFARSRFYREKLERAGFATHGAVGGLEAIEGAPLTEKDELRRSRSADEPIGTHLTASPEEIVRIYSTSGTTGTPSYIPLTAADLEVWVRTSARSYAASGLKARRAHRLDL